MKILHQKSIKGENQKEFLCQKRKKKENSADKGNRRTRRKYTSNISY